MDGGRGGGREGGERRKVGTGRGGGGNNRGMKRRGRIITRFQSREPWQQSQPRLRRHVTCRVDNWRRPLPPSPRGCFFFPTNPFISRIRCLPCESRDWILVKRFVSMLVIDKKGEHWFVIYYLNNTNFTIYIVIRVCLIIQPSCYKIIGLIS